MRSLAVFITLLAAISVNGAHAASRFMALSDSAKISLITMGPGQEELYAAFGHSAFRVKDPINRIDLLFNYGVFNFNQPNFYLNFTKGKLYYELGIRPYERSIDYYFRYNRDIVEQELNLTGAEKQQLYDLLSINAMPDNKHYYYNYCFDNCATRIRDMMQKLLGDQIVYDYTYAADSLTYRNLMDKYLGQQQWGDLGIDFCLGSEIDEVSDGWGYMYMPEYLMAAFANAQIISGDTTRQLVSETTIINKSAPMPSAASPVSPLQVMIGIFLITGLLTHRGFKYGVSYKWIDYGLFGSTGLMSFLLIFLWVGTDHLSKYNFNLIWCTPLNLVFVYYLFRNQLNTTLRYYLISYVLCLFSLILFREWIPQQLHMAFIPLVLALALRSLYWIIQIKQKTDQPTN